MLSPRLYKNSHIYSFFLRSFGYERGIETFLRTIPLDYHSGIRILDAGCGSGMLGLHFLERFPESRLVATDLEPNFLQTTLRNARRRGIDCDRIQTGTSDISIPNLLTSADGQKVQLPEAAFDIICVGAVIGYAADIQLALRHLVRLLAPGGTLINLEMSESFTGKYVSRRYHYHNISLSHMQEVLSDAGCLVTGTSLSIRHLPAKLTRTAIIARKPG